MQMQLYEPRGEDLEGLRESIFQSGVAPLLAELFACNAIEAGFFRLQRRREMGVAGIEAKAYGVEVTYPCDFDEMGRSSKVTGEIFQQKLNAEGCSEGLEVFDGGERKVQRFGGPAIILQPEMEDAGTEGDLFGGLEGAFGLIHCGDAMALVTGDEVESGCRVARPGDLFSFREDGHVHGGSHRIGTEPGGEFADGAAIGVIEVMPRGEDLNKVGPGVMEGVEVRGVEAVGKEEVGRDASGHVLTVAQPAEDERRCGLTGVGLGPCELRRDGACGMGQSRGAKQDEQRRGKG